MLYIQQDSKIRFSSRSSVSCCEGHLLAVSQIYHFEKCLWPINMRKMNFDSGKLSEQFQIFLFSFFSISNKIVWMCKKFSKKRVRIVRCFDGQFILFNVTSSFFISLLQLLRSFDIKIALKLETLYTNCIKKLLQMWPLYFLMHYLHFTIEGRANRENCIHYT